MCFRQSLKNKKNRNKGGRSNKWSADHTRTDGIFWFKYFSIFILLFVETKSYLAVRIGKIMKTKEVISQKLENKSWHFQPCGKEPARRGRWGCSQTWAPLLCQVQGRACQNPGKCSVLSHQQEKDISQIFIFLIPKRECHLSVSSKNIILK